jgi:diguanylate cyclase (GGDEF)-like protein
MERRFVAVEANTVSADPAFACPAEDPVEELRSAQLLLAATFRLSSTRSTSEAADVLADVACALTGAQGAHVYLPDQLGGSVWSNTNTVRSAAPPGTLVFDISREVPDVASLLLAGQDVFVADALSKDAARRPLRLRHAMASVLFVPLLDTGVIVFWWCQQRDAAPVLSDDMRSFLQQGAQALSRRLETTTLRDLSVTDPLTGLINRRGLMQALEDLPARGALLLLDLDHFKRINDTRGHRYGDQVLEGFAELLSQNAPEDGCVARWGGEEFALVLPLDGRNAGAQLFDHLRACWREEGLTFSAGLAEHRFGASAEETVEAADRALYRAKQSGRDQLAYAADVAWNDHVASAPAVPRPRRSAAVESELTLSQLDEALDRELVAPHYQPVISTGTGQVMAVEALARLEHPVTGALLPPACFLPLAERTGRVRRIDALVAATAIRDVTGWRRDGYDIAVGVNVSVDHLDDTGLPARLLQQCSEQGLPPNALIVEITETLQSVTGRGHAAAIQQLRHADVNVTLDDFGTGFSALSYLLRFPVAGIKIDRSFTAALDTDRGRQLVMGIIEIGTSLGLHIVAEGVETAGQLRWLTQHGCPFAQGFLLSRPVAAESLVRVVDELNSRGRRTALLT